MGSGASRTAGTPAGARHLRLRPGAACDGTGEPTGNDDSARHPDGRADGAPEVHPLGEVDARPVAGAVLFVEKGGAVARREAVVELDGGRLLGARLPEMLGDVSVGGIPTRPIQLAPGLSATYVLYHDPHTGFFLERI